jgi:hypothetical protein
MSEHLVELIEAMARIWLRTSNLGRTVLGTMTEEEGVDAVFELLNAGLLKLAIDHHKRRTGFTFSPVPKPPNRPICRPERSVRSTKSGTRGKG